MPLFAEYEKQQKLRSWENYLRFIPLSQSDTVVDLGCSVGDVSRVFSLRVNNVIGIDINKEFIEFCDSRRTCNEDFVLSDFQSADYLSFGDISGIWGSFSLSYLSNPLDYLKVLNSVMSDVGWIALLDVSCFISGNLARDSKYYARVKSFELESYRSGLYDFDFGSKMQGLLKDAGFEIVYFDNDVTDPELNFSGAAASEIIEGWSARLNRMNKLSHFLGEEYPDFCDELLSNLGSNTHEKQGNVRFVVAKKSNKPLN
ncbi:methyltransferase domain-containing protein [Shewanella sp. 3_MG-2023]|uniref:class I SAM-dependent methyltransferase n=1 Tax=Shewanella sp. 3_MG-2023 TaxID=3062635 RepID=UPI0026E3DC25|nr:methyltransferase domain-containing protein [Shewanella sp. 3_MG-2023]MDO6776227.1 methyltransferase domain-containing protein [Shewanella sp. 3_MG-2023]